MRLYILQLGTFQKSGGVPIPGYLVQTDDGTNVLVDSGCPVDTYTGESISITFETEAMVFSIEANGEDYIVNRLNAIGLAPHDIHYLVCTHFDWDHAGCHALFSNARLVAQRAHVEAARTGKHPRFESVRAQWDDPGLHYQLVEGDTTLLPGIELIETSGHVPGHQSMLVGLPKTGAVLLPIDAIQSSDRFDAERREISPQIDMDETGVRASTRKLAGIAQREPVSLTIFGHDAEQWRTLRHSPEFYE